MNITGTFVQPLCGGDIPVMNWQMEEWDSAMELMKKIGIDTIILLRQALGKWLAYKSDYLIKTEGCFEPSYDYMDMFLHLAEKHGMKMFVPTYSPEHDWLLATYDPQKEFELFKPLVDELWASYGHYKAFAGWYMAQEISGRDSFKVIQLFQKLAPYCKRISGGLPVMMSPGMRGVKALPQTLSYTERRALAFTPEKHRSDWNWMMGELKGCIDIIAFQDGHVEFEELETFLRINTELAAEHGIECWSNIESFDRDILNPKFHPIGWEKLLFKIKVAERTNHAKLITYEFVPFLCPDGCYSEAKYLLKQYCKNRGIKL